MAIASSDLSSLEIWIPIEMLSCHTLTHTISLSISRLTVFYFDLIIIWHVLLSGRSFDAMGKKTSVENAQSPADWVTLKGMKDKDKDAKKDEEAPVSIAERRRRRRTGGN